MTKCLIIGTLRVPASVGQAIKLNGKKCDEETVWDITGYGGESHVTLFTVENKSNVDFDIEFDFSTPTDGDSYSITILDSGDDPVVFPFNISKELVNWKLKIDFDKYAPDEDYEIVLKLDYAD